MNSFLLGTIKFLCPFIGMFILGIGIWAIGQWLRRKGYGESLDKVDVKLRRMKELTKHQFGPLSRFLLDVLQSFSKVPFFGNRKRQQFLDQVRNQLK